MSVMAQVHMSMTKKTNTDFRQFNCVIFYVGIKVALICSTIKTLSLINYKEFHV